MCGISGWFLKQSATRADSDLYAMADRIEHRGPDDRGYYFDRERGVAFAHNRLSIIDLSPAGHQPMASDDGSVVLSYNGELYNFLDLRRELEGLGHQFHSRSDSEVVLHAFIEWGLSCLDRFNGMFAFAIWSARDGKLLLARDPLGMKPLYYAALPGDQGFVFASEIKAFLALPDFKVKINRDALNQFLEFGYTFDDHATSLEGVYKLPPGHSMEVVNGSPLAPTRYFNPPMGAQASCLPVPGDLQARMPAQPDLETQLYNALSEVVAQHLIADVPVGLLLSGGIDSSIVAAIAARHASITTISMGFAESDIDERPHARVVADHIGSDHREITIHPHEISEDLEAVAWYFDDLFADWGTVSTRLMYKKCRELGIKVVLVGEGSDELFGGYPIFDWALRARGPMTWKLFQLYRRYAGRRYGSHFATFAAVMRRYLGETSGDLFGAVRLFESRNQLPNNYVMKVDKASMSVSVEARAPFLDRRVAELAYGAPAERLLAEGTNKLVLRRMAERFELLPLETTRREKFGASIAASWMDESQKFRDYARQVILDRSGWVDELGLRSAMTDYFSGKRQGYAFPRSISIFSNLAWRLLLLNLWSRRYVGA
ncbi:MAG TPA: asparagine synthase (glutamine-hydrolyzing) [Blastocatellia bacterium]|nr:asparagine synthase (glutamine-hydrolyzing) [Blastocatellia bacterium]